jgi:hypothetical protein
MRSGRLALDTGSKAGIQNERKTGSKQAAVI